MMKHFVWISFDLGVKGDYEGMYAWLDSKGAKECGDSLACLRYEHESNDLLEDVKKDLNANVSVLQKSLDYTVDSFSINLGKKNIQALVNAAKLGVNLDAPANLGKFFLDDFMNKVSNSK